MSAANTIVTVFLSMGGAGFVTGGLAWLRGRKGDRAGVDKSDADTGKVKVDAAAAVQQMALELVGPINQELTQTRVEAKELRAEMEQMHDKFRDLSAWADDLVRWAGRASTVLAAHGLAGEVDPIPVRVDTPV